MSTLALKKLVVSFVIIGTFVLYTLMRQQSDTAPLAPISAAGPSTSVDSPATPSGSDTSGAAGAADTPSATNTSSAHYKDGTYVGAVTDAQWGYVQVKAIIQRGQIADVQWLQYPNDRSRSVYINSYADPQLTSEAIQAQSAQVDIVTGATDSSFAFMESLSDALSHAQA